MPRLKRRGQGLCVAHGKRCRLGGGSDYVSALCHEEPPVCVVHGRACQLVGGRLRMGSMCAPQTGRPEAAAEAELHAAVRAACEGITAAEAAERIRAEREDERARWEALTCRQVDAELAARWHGCRTPGEGEHAALAELVGAEPATPAEELERRLAERVREAQEAARPHVEPPAPVVEPDPVPEQRARPAGRRRRPPRPQERPSGGAEVTAPPEDTAEPSRPRRRRRRTPQFTSINMMRGFYDDDDED